MGVCFTMPIEILSLKPFFKFGMSLKPLNIKFLFADGGVIHCELEETNSQRYIATLQRCDSLHWQESNHYVAELTASYLRGCLIIDNTNLEQSTSTTHPIADE